MRKFVVLFGILLSLTAFAASAGRYHLLRTVPVPGNEGWDYLTVDTPSRHVFISHGSRVVVMDADTGGIVGNIENTPGVHGIAIADDLKRAFTSNGQGPSSTIFDLKTLKPIGEVKVTGENPDAICYDPASKRVFTFNKRGLNATAIDAVEARVVGTIDIGGNPEFCGVDNRGHAFVDLVDKDIVLQIDSHTLAPGQRWPTSPCQRPGTMAVDTKNSRLFVGCGNKLMAIMDSNTGKVITTIPIGQGRDAAAFDPGTSLIFSSNGDGTLTVIHQESPMKYTVVENAQTENGARTMAVDLKTHRVFLPLADRLPPPAPAPGTPPATGAAARGEIKAGTFRVLIMEMGKS